MSAADGPGTWWVTPGPSRPSRRTRSPRDGRRRPPTKSSSAVTGRSLVSGFVPAAAPYGSSAPSPHRGFENAVFYTDAQAARLSPISVQSAVDADAAVVRKAVRGEGVEVLTGDARRRADPDLDRDREAITAMTALFGTAGGVSAFVSVFVVASTFAFTVAQRRREFGLLRTAGATPGQIRRIVFTEALVVGVIASIAGCLLGSYGAPRLASWLVDGDSRRAGTPSATAHGRITWPSGPDCSSPCAAWSPRPGGPDGRVPPRRCTMPPSTAG